MRLTKRNLDKLIAKYSQELGVEIVDMATCPVPKPFKFHHGEDFQFLHFIHQTQKGTIVNYDWNDLRINSGSFDWETRIITLGKCQSLSNKFSVLLHEASHVMLGHDSHVDDLQQLAEELAAWMLTFELAEQLGIKFTKRTLDNYFEALAGYIV